MNEMTIDILKEKGYRTNIKFIQHIKRGDKLIPIDPEQKAEMWKIDNEYYWIEDNIIICKMGS